MAQICALFLQIDALLAPQPGGHGTMPPPKYATGFNPHPGHVFASLDETLDDDHLCLVDSNKKKAANVNLSGKKSKVNRKIWKRVNF